MTSDHFYITTPIYYVNDKPHIGHAYTTIACDVIARFMRLDGREVRFLTGTDEHGQKIAKSAEKAGIEPKAFTDQVATYFIELAKKLNISNDDFIRTTEERHIKAAQHFWNQIKANGHIYLGGYKGWYAVRDEAFYAESEIVGGLAPTGAPVEWVEEPSYFFDLSKWQDKLLEFYDQNPDFIRPASRRNEVISFVKSGLIDLSVSRTSFSWGVPVPGDEKHVMYVWLDALTNYISALGYPDENGDYSQFWPADIHMVGKDILRFHAIYWPAFLMAAGLEPPKSVVAHGWWMVDGQKMSKSIGNVIDPLQLIEEFGLDQVRYFLLREAPFGNDCNYSKMLITSRINSELANNIGNLAQRTLSMIAKNCAAMVPECDVEQVYSQDLLNSAIMALGKVRTAMHKQAFSEAMEEIVLLAGAANIYIDQQAPWSLAKTDQVKMCMVLYSLAEVIRYIGILLLPFIPDTANKLLDQLAILPEHRSFTALSQEYALASGTKLPAPQGLFPRIM